MKVSVVRIARGDTVFYFSEEVEVREKDGGDGGKALPHRSSTKIFKNPQTSMRMDFCGNKYMELTF